MITVAFACVQNAGRSQMAAAFFNALADPTRARAISAGTRPASHVHPEVAGVMREVGIEIGAKEPQLLSESLAATAQVMVTMGCGETCPLVPGARRLEWNVADPKGRELPQVRAIRDEIRDRVRKLVESEGWLRPGGRSVD